MVRRGGKPPSKYNRRRRKKFSGTRDDTEQVGTKIVRGRQYVKRANAPIYPKLTTITVCSSTREIYAHFRKTRKYNNYDELLLFLVKLFFERISSDEKSMLEPFLKHAYADVELRRLARLRARRKGRYRPR